MGGQSRPTPERQITIGVGTKAATIWRAATRLQDPPLGEISGDAAQGGGSPPDSSETRNAKLARLDGAVREIVRPDANPPSANEALSDMSASVQTIVQRAASLVELQSVIQELQKLHDFLHAEGERLEQEISKYAQISRSVMSTTRAKAATSTIPIVFVTGSDPVATGMVKNLGRPDANITGVTSLNFEIGQKRMVLIHELLPKATAVAALINPNSPTAEAQLKAMQNAAAKLGLKIDVVRASTEQDLTAAFAQLNRLQASTLVITTDAFFISETEKLAHLAALYNMPTIFQFRDFASNGGLISYGGSFAETYRLAGVYVGRILKGGHPSELPVQQSTKIELFINLGTAKALGIVVPPGLLARADEVIE